MITTTIATSRKEMEKARQANQIPSQSLMEIVTFMASMVTKNLIATKRKRKKRTRAIEM